VADPVDLAKAAAVDLRPRLVHDHLTVLPIGHYYSEYWAIQRDVRTSLDLPGGLPATFPAEEVLLRLVRPGVSHQWPRCTTSSRAKRLRVVGEPDCAGSSE
jgi:hypothetical protein